MHHSTAGPSAVPPTWLGLMVRHSSVVSYSFMGLLALILDIVRSRCCLAAEVVGIAENSVAEVVCSA